MTKVMQDKVAIVTGASNGIGKGIAEAFGAEGAKTVVVARRAELLDELAHSIESAGGTALPIPTDVSKEEDILALYEKVMQTYGRVDVLVNNAGVASATSIEDMTLDYWNEVLAINLTGPMLMSREAVKIMKAQTPQGGRIINMGSISAKTPRHESPAYTATKHALQGLTHQLTMDGRQYKVVSSIIHPGSTLSGFTTRGGRTTSGPGDKPENYVMSASDVARVAVLMASLPDEVNLYEATILPNQGRSFIGRG